MLRCAAGRVWEEAVYLAYYLHWSLGEILDLPHRIRAQVIEQVGTINVQRGAVLAEEWEAR
jgi:hypothetical protein